MQALNRQKLLMAVAILLGLWLIVDLIYAGLVVQRIAEVSRELVARHQELARMWGWEEIRGGDKN